MTLDDDKYDMDEKETIVCVECAEEPPLRSNYANLTPHQARRKFWRLYFMAMSLCIGGMYVGYAVVAPGNVVANPGFIQVRAPHETC